MSNGNGYINRLFAATLIAHGIHIENDDATITHIQWQGTENDDGDPPGFYIASSVNACSRTHSPYGSNLSEWKRVGWKDVIKILRERFRRRVKGQCSVVGHIFDSKGNRIDIQCIETRQHFHCASCAAPEAHIGCYSKLCGVCTEKSDEQRRKLTHMIIMYEAEFGVGFREWKDYRDEFEGRYDHGPSRSRSDREDFHADG